MTRSIDPPNTVVTEINIGLNLKPEDREYYTKCTNVINDTVSMYDVSDEFLAALDGDIKTTFELINACIDGKVVFNGGVREEIGADYYLHSLAYQLGWAKDNNTTIQYYKDINDNYHPNRIAEVASIFYETVRNRNKFLSMYPSKLEEVVKIVKLFKDKKIVIFNDGTKPCNKLIDLLNNNGIRANPYYSNLESIPMVDKDGNPILYKTGSKKGMQKLAGATRRKKQALLEFKEGICNIISFSSNLYKDVDIEDIEIVIFTSGKISKIRNMVRKAKPINFRIKSKDVHVFNLYIVATIDEDRFIYRQINNNNRLLHVHNFEHFEQLYKTKHSID